VKNAKTFIDKIQSRKASVAVCGLGYVGLPLVNAFLRSGFRVFGFDIDVKKIESLKTGVSYIKHIDFPSLKAAIDAGRFVVTADFGRIGEPDAILIAVPTPLNKTREPDLSAVTGTSEQIRGGLRKDQLVILESTTYPGTTEEVCLPIFEESGLSAKEDFFLAYSPEREDPGNPNFETRTIPKVVGGYDSDALAVARALYESIIEKVVPVSDMKAAELCKIFENTFRAVNIALVNELKMMCLRMDIDVWEVIDAAATKPFGFMPFYPGPGLGGHCIPIDPFYLTWKAREYEMSTRFIELAGEINTQMPYHVVDGLMRTLSGRGVALKGANVLILGIAYKPDVDDIRESPALKIIDLLRGYGANVSYNDPHRKVMDKTRHFEIDMESQDLTREFLAKQDACLVVTNHKDYDWEFIAKHAKLLVDTRNAAKHVVRRDNIIKM
jgi:UDP-N-acetyl-D-glucosamine dehydrogenase